ncbi:MAG: TA system VapC family ribonuclease toxin [Acidobacteriota bacterium]
MPGIIDTNLLLYAANADADEHEAAAEFLVRAGTSPEQWYFTEGILYEFLRVATHPAVFPKPLDWQEGVRFLRPLVSSSRFRVILAGERHWDVLEQVLGQLSHPAGNLFFDIRTVALMREHGIREVYTNDTDFLQFSGIKVINPLRT